MFKLKAKYKFGFETEFMETFWKLPCYPDNWMLLRPSFSPEQMSVAANSFILCRANARQADSWEDECSGVIGNSDRGEGPAGPRAARSPPTAEAGGGTPKAILNTLCYAHLFPEG